MYTDESVIDTILKKDNPKAAWASIEHRNKAMSIIMYNHRISDVSIADQVIKAINRIPSSDIKNVTWFDLQHVYECPKVW